MQISKNGIPEENGSQIKAQVVLTVCEAHVGGGIRSAWAGIRTMDRRGA